MSRVTWPLSLLLALSVSLISSTATLANSDNPKCPPFQCSSTQGGSTNDCQSGGPGCVDNKQNPGGKNKTCTTNVDSKCN
jgi:hypothetical protein